MRRVLWCVLAIVVGLALLGPFLAPFSPTESVGPSFDVPTSAHPLGTDHLGRDVASRILHGGLPVVVTSVLAALLGSLVGASVGLIAALASSRRAEGLVLRPFDALAAVPPLLVLLLVLTATPGRAGIVLAVALTTAPLTARVARAAAAPVVARGHVEAARARGEGTGWLVVREVGPLVADAGIRLVAAVYLVTAAGFLGLTPGDTDWGLLIVEALPGAEIAPVALAVPVALVAALAVSVNLLADAAAGHGRVVLA